MFGEKTKILGPSVCNEPDISSFAGDFDYKKTNSQSIADYFIEYVAQLRQSKPQIIYLNFYDLHAKYRAREPFYSRFVFEENNKILQDLGDFYALHFQEMNDEIEISESIVAALRASYAARLAMIDEDLGRVIEKLKGCGFLDNSIMVITSDHGDVLGDHKKPSFHHQFSIYNSLLQIPLIFCCKAIEPPKRISVPLIQNVDILPTILELCGIKKPSPLNNSPGVSLTEYLFNSNYNVIPRKYAVSTYESPLRFIVRNKKKVNPKYLKNLMAIQDNEYKLIFSDDGKLELYYIREDRFEKDNVVDKLPQKVTELKNAFYEIMEKYNAPIESKDYPDNNSHNEAIMLQKLKALGYIE
jgi:arylsulfatase A-like enzyme